jgi:hypothetical protein
MTPIYLFTLGAAIIYQFNFRVTFRYRYDLENFYDVDVYFVFFYSISLSIHLCDG